MSQDRTSGANALPVCCVCMSEGRAFRHDILECRFVRPCDRYAVQVFSRQVNTTAGDEQQDEVEDI